MDHLVLILTLGLFLCLVSFLLVSLTYTNVCVHAQWQMQDCGQKVGTDRPDARLSHILRPHPPPERNQVLARLARQWSGTPLCRSRRLNRWSAMSR